MRGFSLIETIIYIALLGVLMAGTLMTVYQLIQGSSLVGQRNTIQEEGNFVLRKIEWAMSGARSVDATLAENLFITRYDGVIVHFQRTSATNPDRLTLSTDEGTMPITTENVNVDAFTIAHIAPNGTAPEGFTLTLTLDGVDFVTTHYVR